MIQQMSSEEDVLDTELLHAPIWFVRYDHKGNQIVLVLDGNSGNVIHAIQYANEIGGKSVGITDWKIKFDFAKLCDIMLTKV